jgi:GNAT superfamily N-acetyltransferase
MKLRIASLTDIPVIRSIVYEAWPVAYSSIISKQQLDYMLDMMYSDASLQKQIGDDRCEFILAEDETGVSGFASYSLIKDKAYKLHKLYLYSSQKGKGIGKILLEEVCTLAKAAGGKTIELQVNKLNNAKEFYLHNGFIIDRELVLDIGNGFVMDDYVMIRMLRE